MEETIQKVVHENPDSFEIGTPGKAGTIKVYGDYSKPEEFKKKLEQAEEVRKFAQANIFVNT